MGALRKSDGCTGPACQGASSHRDILPSNACSDEPATSDSQERTGHLAARAFLQDTERAQSARLTPASDTNGIGCHDPLLDVCGLSPQVSRYIGLDVLARCRRLSLTSTTPPEEVTLTAITA